MPSLELKIPPPAIALIVGLLMWQVSVRAQIGNFFLPGHAYVAVAILIAGLTLDLLALFAFLRQKTTINPLTPGASSSLVVAGIYRFTRNPMYLGLLLALAAWAVFLSNALAFLLLPVFILYINRFQIKPEENALAQKFGPEFSAYQARVRRWI